MFDLWYELGLDRNHQDRTGKDILDKENDMCTEKRNI